MNTIQVVHIISFVSTITPAMYLLVEIVFKVVTISSNTNIMNTIQVVNIIFFFFYCYSHHATTRCNLPQDSTNKIKRNNVNTIQDVHIIFIVSSITPNIYMLVVLVILVVTVALRKKNNMNTIQVVYNLSFLHLYHTSQN